MEQNLIELLSKEEIRRAQEDECIRVMSGAGDEISASGSNLHKYIQRMAQKMLQTCDKIRKLRFPFPNSDYQVQEIMNAEETPDEQLLAEILKGESVEEAPSEMACFEHAAEGLSEAERALIFHEDDDTLVEVRDLPSRTPDDKVLKCCIDRSRSLFDLVVSKYKAVIQRK